MARISVPRDVGKPQEYGSDGTDAVGFVQFWGNSPALDLINDAQASAFGPLAVGASPGQQYQDKTGVQMKEEGNLPDDHEDDDKPKDPIVGALPEEGETVNFLIVGGADIRHVLKTIARRRRLMPGRKFKFYLHESCHETLARHLLFIQIINNTAIPVRERMELFLSLHGNTMVREKDLEYVSDIAKECIELVTEESLHPLADIVSLSHLKHKDRDIIQDCFKNWFKDVPFDIEALREQRCRGYYRDRYDYRKNMMDLNYQNHIKHKAGIINWFHYKEFCFTGVAFETRLGSYNMPNRTLSAHTRATDRTKGTTVEVRGFWGDIINTPYHCFGTTTDPQDHGRLFKISGSMYRQHEGDVAEFNVTALIHEMDTGDQFHLPAETPEEHVFPYASPLDQMRDDDKKAEEVTEPPEAGYPAADAKPAGRGRRAPKKVDWPPLSPGFADCDIHLLTGDLNETLRKSKYRGLFHRAFVGAMSTVPILEEAGLTTGGGDDTFKINTKIRKPPRVEAPEAFGKKREQSSLGMAMREGGTITFETLKYQAQFEGSARLAFRHRLAQCGHLAGWQIFDERRSLPRIEHDMKDGRARDLEKDATDFIRFATPGPVQS